MLTWLAGFGIRVDQMNNTESFILWYLRFNGYFAIPNFTTHPNFKKKPGSAEVDVLAVKFQHSEEHQTKFIFERDECLIREVPIDVVLAEVKSSTCGLNDTWTNPAFKNVEYALRWVGRWEDSKTISQIAESIYNCGEWQNTENLEMVRFVCFGMTPNQTLKTGYPTVSQILFCHVIEYMRSRMTKCCYQIHRERWEPFIGVLGKRFDAHQSDEQILEWLTGSKGDKKG